MFVVASFRRNPELSLRLLAVRSRISCFSVSSLAPDNLFRRDSWSDATIQVFSCSRSENVLSYVSCEILTNVSTFSDHIFRVA